MRTELKHWLHAQLVAPLFAPMGGGPHTSFRRRRGVALVLALLFIVLLTVLVVEFSYETQVEASIATNNTGDLEAYLAAKSAVAQGMSMLWNHLISVQNGEIDMASGGLGGGDNNPQPINPSGGEPYDGKYDQWAIGVPFEPINDATMRVSISDEYGKINLNALLVPGPNGEPTERMELVETLRAFFSNRIAGGESDSGNFDPVDAILDWLDYGESDNERNDGAEDDYYMGLERPYHCKNAPMDSIEELLLIKGITTELYFGDEESGQLPLSEYLTVHGHWTGAINVNTAQIEVLEAAQIGYNVPGTRFNVNPQQFSEIMARVSSGETIYTMGEIQSMNNQRGNRNRNNQNNQNNQDNQNNQNNNRQGGQRSSRVISVDSALPFRELRAELPRPQAILDGLWTPYAALAPIAATTPAPRTVVAQNTPTRTPVDRNNDGIDDNTGQPIAQQQGGNNRAPAFVISSNCFRIYGDGMQGEVLVRIEAYVWRNSPMLNPEEIRALLPQQIRDEWTPPTENFRILDWKVIR